MTAGWIWSGPGAVLDIFRITGLTKVSGIFTVHRPGHRGTEVSQILTRFAVSEQSLYRVVQVAEASHVRSLVEGVAGAVRRDGRWP